MADIDADTGGPVGISDHRRASAVGVIVTADHDRRHPAAFSATCSGVASIARRSRTARLYAPLADAEMVDVSIEHAAITASHSGSLGLAFAGAVVPPVSASARASGEASGTGAAVPLVTTPVDTVGVPGGFWTCTPSELDLLAPISGPVEAAEGS